MVIIQSARQSDKASELIKLSNKTQSFIVCINRDAVENIVKRAKDMGLSIPYPITLRELPVYGKNVNNILIDNIENILSELLDKDIQYASTSSEIYKI